MKFGLPLLLVFSCAFPLCAQESSEELEERPNTAELFLGAATEAGDGSTGFAIGLGYLRHISGDLKVALVLEHVSGEVSREWLILLPFYVQPAGGLLLGMGPGIDRRDEAHEDGDEELTAFFATRFSAAWEFELGRFTISPEVNLDVVDGGATWVYGMAFGLPF